MIKITPLFSHEDIKIHSLDKNVKQGIRKGFYFAGKSLVKESIKLINTKPKSGRFYRVGVGIGGKALKNIRTHQASAAGEAPAVITGRLRRNTDFLVHASNFIEFGNKLDYGKFLEVGTSKMAKRPYLQPAIKNDAKNTTNYIRREIIRALK